MQLDDDDDDDDEHDNDDDDDCAGDSMLSNLPFFKNANEFMRTYLLTRMAVKGLDTCVNPAYCAMVIDLVRNLSVYVSLKFGITAIMP